MATQTFCDVCSNEMKRYRKEAGVYCYLSICRGSGEAWSETIRDLCPACADSLIELIQPIVMRFKTTSGDVP